jgi:hypothetical protein
VNPSPCLADLSLLTCTVPVFRPGRDDDPVLVGSWDDIPSAAGHEAATRLATAGFALIQASQVPGPAAARQLASQLGLGPPFTPPQYRDSPHVDGQGVTRISTEAGASHPAFGQATGQHLHSDGTLQRIGEIKTTMMLCARPAASGGTSQLFNAAGAFALLLHQDPAAAAALTAPDVLIRTSALPGSRGQFTAGPVFAVADGRVISRYSVTSTDRYDHDAVADPAALDRALDFLQDAAQPGSPCYTELTLAAGQGLLLANDLISHGRTAYHDDPAVPRLILRALFTRRCLITEQAA